MKSIIKDDDPNHCYICRRYISHGQVHHCIHGTAGRRKAEKYGLTVHLCSDCHRLLHDTGYFDKYLEKTAQMYFERKYSHREWMATFNKNYREEI